MERKLTAGRLVLSPTSCEYPCYYTLHLSPASILSSNCSSTRHAYHAVKCKAPWMSLLTAKRLLRWSLSIQPCVHVESINNKTGRILHSSSQDMRSIFHRWYTLPQLQWCISEMILPNAEHFYVGKLRALSSSPSNCFGRNVNSMGCAEQTPLHFSLWTWNNSKT